MLVKMLKKGDHFLYMDMSNIENVKKMTTPESEWSPYYTRELERFVRDGEPFEWNCDYETFRELVTVLSLETIQGEDILRHSVYNTSTGYEVDSIEREYPPLEGAIDTEALLNYVADTQSFWADDPNDFKATFMAKFDDTTTVAIGLESHETSRYEASFTQTYWIALFASKDNENYPSWNHWDLEFFDTKAAKREYDIQDLEREIKEGVTNLSRLKQGDLLRVTARLSQSSKDAVYRPLANAQMEQRFVYDFVVLEEGEQPIIESRNAQGDTEKAVLVGSGIWTTRRQNPVQKQDTALTISHGFLRAGSRIISRDIETGESSYSETVIESIEVLKA